MKKRFICGLLVAIAVASGCATSTELIKTSSVGTRSDVFRELPGGGSIPQDHAYLRISSSLKTHKPGIYPFEKKLHGLPDYILLINIDGQVERLIGDLSEEDLKPRGMRDPEAGDGIRYRFTKELYLKAGTHRIVIAVPDDGIAVEREIPVNGGERNILVLEPLYGMADGRQRPGFYGITSFTEGLKGFRVILNGRPI